MHKKQRAALAGGSKLEKKQSDNCSSSKNSKSKQLKFRRGADATRAPCFEYRLPWNKRHGRKQRPLIHPRPYKREQLADRYRGLCACGEHAWAVLTQGYVTLVSPKDVHHLQDANWHASKVRSRSHLVYAAVSRLGAHRYLHRVILGEPNSEIDHKDFNGTNNQRKNLRLGSQSQHRGHSRRRKNKSGFRGVVFRGVVFRGDHRKRGGRWLAFIACNGKTRHLGTFDSPEKAARTYDAAAIEYFGAEFAVLNFDGKQPRLHRVSQGR